MAPLIPLCHALLIPEALVATIELELFARNRPPEIGPGDKRAPWAEASWPAL